MVFSSPALAQTAPYQRAPEIAKAESAWVAAYDRKDYPAAEAALGEVIRLSPADPIARYNLACVLALQNKVPEGEAALKKALGLGFADFARLLADDSLANLRATDTFVAVKAGWRELQDAVIDDKFARFRATLKSGGKSADQRGYVFEKDDVLRLGFVSAFSKKGHADTIAEINRATRLWQTAVLPAKPEATLEDAEKARPDPWVLVFLPTPADYSAWAASQFGAKAGNIGGVYNNHSQELTARDLGPTLRHEFWHVLHYRHMARLGEYHPAWIQEGLCSLVEDIEVVDDDKGGTLKPVHSWRSNMAKRMMGNNLLPHLGQLMAMSDHDFATRRMLGNYAAARTFFLWLSEQGQLRAWYGAYIADYKTDRTGKKTTEALFGKPIEKVDADFRKWLAAAPEVGEVNTPGAATLPFDLQPVGGEGLEVEAIPGGTSLRMPVMVGDYIVAIAGHPVRDQSEMARVLGGYKPEDVVELTVRREGQERKVKVGLLRYE